MQISISKDFIADGSSNVTLVRTYAADTTIREVAEGVQPLWELISSGAPFVLWDCTLHPPKDISDWPTKQYPDLQGPYSKTLYDSGYFPSGTWRVLPLGVHPSDVSRVEYDDYQYNNQQYKLKTEALPLSFTKSEALASSKPLPSQVMEAVLRRFETDDNHEPSTEEAKQARRQNRIRIEHLNSERARKLEDRIRKLEEESSEKNKSVSDQVRKMLVKSRATGNSNLKMQDRIYFQCFLDDGITLARDYRFFSPQDTIARVAKTFPARQGMEIEVLARRASASQDDEIIYKRLPATMRIYEAVAQNYLSDQVDVLVIRWFSQSEEATPCILDDADRPNTEPVIETQTEEQSPENVVPGDALSNVCFEDHFLSEAIRSLEEEDEKGKSSKKKSAASVKVRRMLMKSKARGDFKRVPKIEDRFFMDVLLVQDGKATSSFQFLAKADPIARIIDSVAGGTVAADWEFLVPSGEKAFARIHDPSLSLQEAQEENVLQCFDRLILRRSKR